MQKQKILIIEDDKFFRDLISKKFEAGGFDIASAKDSKDAFEYLEKEIPTAIILDLILPGLDGYGILSLIKKEKRLSAIPVVILSNLGQKDEVDKAISLGADDFLVKVNFIPDEIVARIKSLIQQKYI